MNNLGVSWQSKFDQYCRGDMLFECLVSNTFFQVIVPTPLEGGGNYILKWVFFVQTILAHRYIHRRELRLVSIESLSSVEYGIKKIFLFSFLTGSYRGLNFWEKRVNSVDFYSHFSEFLNKISPILLKFVKIFQESDNDFIFRDKKCCPLFWNFLSKTLLKYFTKCRLFHQKQHETSFFRLLWLNLCTPNGH